MSLLLLCKANKFNKAVIFTIRPFDVYSMNCESSRKSQSHRNDQKEKKKKRNKKKRKEGNYFLQHAKKERTMDIFTRVACQFTDTIRSLIIQCKQTSRIESI